MKNKQDIIAYAKQVKEGCRRWLETVRVPDLPLGHFRFNAHSYHPWALFASWHAWNVYKHLGINEELSDEDRTTWAGLFMRHYRPDIQLFVCPQLVGDKAPPVTGNSEAKRRIDGAAPFKKVAPAVFELAGTFVPNTDDGTRGFSAPAELEGFLETYRKESTAYGMGSVIGEFSSKRTLALRSNDHGIDGDPWIEWMYGYIDRIRDPATGFVTAGRGDAISGMNGLFKLSPGSFWKHRRPMPKGRAVIDAVLELLDPAGGFGENCEDMNASLLLCKTCAQEDHYRYEDVTAAVSGPVLRRLEERRRPDGGISFHTGHCRTNANGYQISDPLPEGDTAGAHQQLNLLNALVDLLDGREPSPL